MKKKLASVFLLTVVQCYETMDIGNTVDIGNAVPSNLSTDESSNNIGKTTASNSSIDTANVSNVCKTAASNISNNMSNAAASKISSIGNTVPSDFSMLDSWVNFNIGEFDPSNVGHTSTIDEALRAAQMTSITITVSKNENSMFRTITDALNSIPVGNKNRTIIYIGGGQYHEKITIPRSKPFITFYGDPSNMPIIVYDGTAKKYGTVYSATVAVESDYFVAFNIAFVNSAPMPNSARNDEQAVALRISGDKAAFHRCQFLGFQDTLCDYKGRHFFKDCLVRGTVDFIFGDGKSLYLNTTIESVAKQTGVITAQGRLSDGEDSGFTFIHCNITGNGNNTYLGRAWRIRPKVVFAYTYMGTTVNQEGWSTGNYPDRSQTVFYGEYMCKGPGATTSHRVKYAKLLTTEEAKPYLNMGYIDGKKWLLPLPKPIFEHP